MYRVQLLILLLLFFVPALQAQDSEDTADEAEQAQEDPAAVENDVSDEEIEELLGLDEDYSDIEDDDFKPTEGVRFEQSIPFPTDI